MPNTCPGCGCSNPGDFDDSSGNIVCTKCGTVVNDSHIVSDITFGENSAGAATVQGSFVGAGQTHANTGGRYRSGTSIESREQTIAEGISITPPLPLSHSTQMTSANLFQRGDGLTRLAQSLTARNTSPTPHSDGILSHSPTTSPTDAKRNM
jgi:hypothetical protein